MLPSSGERIGSRSKGSATPLLSRRARRMARAPKRRRISSAAAVARRRRSSTSSKSDSCCGLVEMRGGHPQQSDLDAAQLRPGQLAAQPPKMTSVWSVGSARVRWRVMVTNDGVAHLDGDRVAPGHRPARSRPATPSERARSVRSMTSGSRGVDVEGVLVADRPGRLPTGHGGGIDAPRSLGEDRTLPTEAPCQQVVGKRRQVADGRARRSRRASRRVRSPTPHSRPIGSGARNAASSPGLDDDETVGLAQVRGDLGHEPGRRHADRGGQPQLARGWRP